MVTMSTLTLKNLSFTYIVKIPTFTNTHEACYINYTLDDVISLLTLFPFRHLLFFGLLKNNKKQ